MHRLTTDFYPHVATIAYLESLRQGQPPPVPGVAGLQELQVEAAIKRSIAQNRPVDLAAELPLGLRNT